MKDFDFQLNLSDQNDIGAESSKLQFSGKGQHDGVDFTFSGPISLFKVQYELSIKENLDLKYNANIFAEKDFVITVDASSLKVEGASLDDAARTELVNKFTQRVVSYKAEI